MPTDTATADVRSVPPLIVDIDQRSDLWSDVFSDTATRVDQAVQSAWALLDYPNRPYDVSVVLADDAFQRGLNRQYRDKDASTNVLSFPSGVEPDSLPPSEPVPIGDIVLALETLQREADAAGLALEDHFSHLLVHGMLHLAGFDHQTEHDAEEMEALEIDALDTLGIGNPYAAARTENGK